MINFITTPVPHEEARRRIADRPAVSRDVFDRLPEEMQARAFTITGIEDMDVVQAVRDELAKIPAGGDWNAAKREIMARISPWFSEEGAAARAELLLRHHTFAAYSATQARIMDEMIDVFPFRQYLSTKDGKVRASHRALNDVILPADHHFWTYHTPPWEYNCRCQCVELTQEDRDEEYERDQKRTPENRRVLEGANLRQLDTGSLNRGLSINVDVRTPKERGGNYQWSARDASLPYEEIKKRWDPATASDFEAWAGKQDLDGGGNLLAYLSGQPVTPGPRLTSLVRPATFAAALRTLGLDAKDKWTRKDIADLKSSLRIADPALEAEHIVSITGARKSGALTEKEIRRTVQDMLDIIPRPMADTLPKLRIKLSDGSLGSANGQYDPKEHAVEVTTHHMRGKKGEARRRELRRVLSHELMHWVHLSSKGPAADAYRESIKDHYVSRTAGERLIGGSYRRDKWWDLYAGREYGFERGNPRGVEVPTRYYELWETPDILSTVMDPAQTPDAAAIRETFSLVHSFFDQPQQP